VITGAGLEARVFGLVLLVIAWLMVVTSRVHPRIRRQLSQDLLFEISSADGARQLLRIDSRTRTISAPRVAAREADCVLRFARGRDGIVTLLSTQTAGRIVRGMNRGEIEVEGNAVLVLWLHGLTRVVAPIGRTRVPRRPIPAPVRGPEREASYAERIVREPPQSELDRDWREAWRARETLLQLRGPAGEVLPPG
jgi:hypothetical protein